MKKTYLYKTLNVILLLVFFVGLQMAQYKFVFGNVLFPTYAYLDILFILFLGSIVFIFPSRTFDKIYIPVIYAITVIFTLVNINFYNTTGDIFSMINLMLIENSLNVASSAAAMDYTFTSLGTLSVFLLFGLMFVSDRIFRGNNVKSKLEFKQKRVSTLTAGLLLTATSFLIYDISYLATVPDYINNTIMLEKKANFKDYGMLNYYLNEGPYIIKGDKVNDETTSELQQYFTREEDVKNSFSGLLKDYNVVNICVETGDDLMLNETLAPNLFSLYDDAITLDRNYSKNKTNISEFIGMAGSAPVAGINNKYDYNLPFSVPSILHEDGYHTLYFHDAPKDKDVYKRRELMPKLNFDEVYFREEMFPGEPGWDFSGSYSFDSDAMPVVADKILKHKDEKFYAFYMTLSMHGPYDQPKNHAKLEAEYGEKYHAAVNNGDFVNPLKGTVNEHCVDNFMMAVMDFDKGLGEFINKFKENGCYDNTLFVIYADHEMYYVGADGIPLNRTLAGTKDMSNSKMYKTQMCLVNPKLKEKFGDRVYDQFTSPYNVAPTTLDLLGYDYNPNYYLGNSLFSEHMRETQVFYTLEQAGFFNEDFWALNHKEVFRTFNDEANEKDFIEAVEKVVDKEAKLNMIYTNDFFTHHDFNDFTYNTH